MRVFVTGATGYIGSAIVEKLITRGHSVLGLARSVTAASKLTAIGVDVLRGDLNSRDCLTEGARLCDGIVHTAFNHDFSSFAQNCEDDRNVINTLGQAVLDSERPLIVASGTAILKQGIIALEKHSGLSSQAIPRIATEDAANSMTDSGANVSIVRLPPTVHGNGDKGFVTLYSQLSKEIEKCVYVGQGENVWPAVHKLDAAELFCLALENSTKGSTYHAVAEEGIAFKTIAETVGNKLSLPVTSVDATNSKDHLSWFNDFAVLDNPASSIFTREKLGWAPKEIGLIEDIKNNYF